MRFEERLIGPAEAADMLSRNYESNRKVRASWVRQLASMMSAGEFNGLNGDVLRVGADGTLYDGQHRLAAVVESGVTLPLVVATVDDAEAAFVTMDNGSRRTAADYMPFGDRSTAAAVAKVLFCLEHGKAAVASCIQGKVNAKEVASRVDIVSYANDNREGVEFYRSLARSLRDAIGRGSVTAFAAALFLHREVGGGVSAEAFVDECKKLAPDSPTCSAYMSLMRKSFLGTTRPRPVFQTGVTLLALDHFEAADGVTMLNKAAVAVARYDKKLAEWRERSGR